LSENEAAVPTLPGRADVCFEEWQGGGQAGQAGQAQGEGEKGQGKGQQCPKSSKILSKSHEIQVFFFAGF